MIVVHVGATVVFCCESVLYLQRTTIVLKIYEAVISEELVPIWVIYVKTSTLHLKLKKELIDSLSKQFWQKKVNQSKTKADK